jgi:outer membrane biosynthesis protein TonB
MNRYLKSFTLALSIYALFAFGIYLIQKSQKSTLLAKKIELSSIKLVSQKSIKNEKPIKTKAITKPQKQIVQKKLEPKIIKPKIQKKIKHKKIEPKKIEPKKANPIKVVKKALEKKVKVAKKKRAKIPKRYKASAKIKSNYQHKKRAKLKAKRLLIHKKTKHTKKSKAKKSSHQTHKGSIYKKPKGNPNFLFNLVNKINSNKYYPKAAQRANIKGLVRASFTITSSGNVANITLNGPSIFYNSTRNAIVNSFPINTNNAPFALPKRVDIKISYR